jgi:cytochrome c
MPLVTTPAIRSLAAAGVFIAGVTASAAIAQPPSPPAATTTPPAMFAVCQACHESTAGAAASVGPNLFNVGGRKAGSLADYDYSPAMKSATTVWTADTLGAFLIDPNKAVPGNKMDYPGNDAATAKAIADYLMTLKG